MQFGLQRIYGKSEHLVLVLPYPFKIQISLHFGPAEEEWLPIGCRTMLTQLTTDN